MPDNSITFLGIITILFVSILILVHRAAKKRESVLREQLGNLGSLLDEVKSSSQKQVKEFGNQISIKDDECSKLRKKLSDLENEINTRVATLMYEWRAGEVDKLREELKASATHEAKNLFEQWVIENKKSISEDARRISRAVIAGQVAERFIPFMPSVFQYNPKDARFIGSPIDLIVFDGADEDDVRRIIFVEVKTGNSVLSPRQKQIKRLVQSLGSQTVKWEETRIPEEI
jgi:predicted Holliday junction resolvase-like endonuclease